MELDFNRINFCGREKELDQLKAAFQDARGSCCVFSPADAGSTDDNNKNKPGIDGGTKSSNDDKGKEVCPHCDQPRRRRPCQRVVLIDGPAGCGKSSLVKQFTRHVTAKSARRKRTRTEGSSDSCFSVNDDQNHPNHISEQPPTLMGFGKFENCASSASNTSNTKTKSSSSRLDRTTTSSTGSSVVPFATISECLNSLLVDLTIGTMDTTIGNRSSQEKQIDDSLNRAENACIEESKPSKIENLTKCFESIDPEDLREIRRLRSIVPMIREMMLHHGQAQQQASSPDQRCPGNSDETSVSTIDTTDMVTPKDSSGSNKKTTKNSMDSLTSSWGFEKICVSVKLLLRVLCKNYTVILCVDDIQWADEQSMKLLQTIIHDNYSQRLLILATQRSENGGLSNQQQQLPGIDSTTGNGNDGRLSPKFRSQLLSMNSEHKHPNDTVVCISLQDFDVTSVCNILSNLLQRDTNDVLDLAKIVHSRTGGSIYFAIQYARILYDRNLINYNLTTYRWEYDCDRILSETDIIADNVIQLVCDKITSLPTNVRVPITVAAFLNFHQFDTNLLYLVTSGLLARLSTATASFLGHQQRNNGSHAEEQKEHALTRGEFVLALETAVKDGLLEQLNKGGGIIDSRATSYPTQISSENSNKWYKFSHDRVKEGTLLALDSSSEHQRRELHMHVGQELRLIREGKLWSNDDDDEAMTKILLLSVQHLNNAGVGIIVGRGTSGNDVGDVVPYQERVDLARMNLEVAEYVLQKTAYPLSVTFLTAGLSLLEKETRWKEHYDLTLKLSSTLIHARFCSGMHDDNWDTMEEILTNAKTPADRHTVHRVYIYSLKNVGHFKEALHHNMLALKELNMCPPQRFLVLQIFPRMVRTTYRIGNLTVEDFSKFTKEAEDNTIHQLRLLGLLLENSIHFCNPFFRALVMSRIVNLALDEQIKEVSAIGMVCCSLMYGMRGRRDKSYKFAKGALDAAKDLSNPLHMIRILGATPHFMLHWYEPYHSCLEPLLASYKLGLEVGQIEVVHQMIVPYTVMYFHCGLHLEPLKKDMLRFVETLEDFGQAEQLKLYRPTVQLVASLMGLKDDDGDTSNSVTIASVRLEDQKIGTMMRQSITLPEEQSKIEKQFYLRQQMILAYYLGDIKLANEMSSKLSRPFTEGPVSWLPPRLYFQGLVAFAMFRMTKKRRYYKQGKCCLRRLRKFTKEGNVNCYHMFLILEAECSSLTRYNKKTNFEAVRKAYNGAIVAAGRLGFLNDQALANELCGAYCLKVADGATFVSLYFTRAYDLYCRWGARAKAKQLKQKYIQYIDETGSTAYDSTFGSGLKARTRLDGIVNPSELSKHLSSFE